MKAAILKAVRKTIKATQSQAPHWPFFGKRGLFNTARTTRRYLSSIAATSAGATTGQPASPAPKRGGVPRKIWFLADLAWEPGELIPELQKICEVVVTDLHAANASSQPREHAAEITRQAVAGVAPDLILLYAREGLLSQPLFDILRKLGVPIWGMNLDDKIDFFADEYSPYRARDGYSRWACHFDLNLTSTRAIIESYTRLGANVEYFPEGFHLRPEFLLPRPQTAYPLSFVGAWREDRAELIQALARDGLDVAAFGPGWPRGKAGQPWEIFRSSQISLGVGYSASSYLTSLKARDFECPGSGACYLTTYNWELSQHFEVGREILCYRNTDELVEMLTYYQPRPELCAEIARAGFERAKRDHTWEQRFRTLFAKAY